MEYFDAIVIGAGPGGYPAAIRAAQLGASVAIRAGIKAGGLGSTIHAHPTFAEAWMEAAHALHGTAIHAAPVRKG